MQKIKNYVLGSWVEGSGKGNTLYHAVTGKEIGIASTEGLDFKSIVEYGRNAAGASLRKMTFHDRAMRLKALAMYLNERKNEYYKISAATGATKADSWVDIDGGIGTMFVFASKGRRELPNDRVYVDGKPELISKGGTFIGQHIRLPLEGVAIHINAFNFPVWGMMEKIAVNLLAGMPAIVKPATSTCYLTELVVKDIIGSGIFPEGSLQLICGSAGDILDHVNCQDVVTFTGSASTGRMLKQKKAIIENSVRFNMEADSLNCSILGPDA
ncbi:MAG TPA: aldehyde dehydrogenase family protein, partial [Bacteroidia bacterium]|nr:aldehyde dehydrogenase family protein [Bacteroidia bacterium]